MQSQAASSTTDDKLPKCKCDRHVICVCYSIQVHPYVHIVNWEIFIMVLFSWSLNKFTEIKHLKICLHTVQLVWPVLIDLQKRKLNHLKIKTMTIFTNENFPI